MPSQIERERHDAIRDLAQDPALTPSKISKALNIPRSTVYDNMSRMESAGEIPLRDYGIGAKGQQREEARGKRRKKEQEPSDRPNKDSKESWVKETGDKGSLMARGLDIKTYEDAWAACNLDLTVWEPYDKQINFWETSMKVKDEEGIEQPVTVTNCQVKAKIRKKPRSEQYENKIDLLIQDAREHMYKYQAPKRKAVQGEYLGEVSIPDFHLGKYYSLESIEDSLQLWDSAVKHAIDKLSHYPLDRILFPVGNDFYNVDNIQMTTTAGTPQHERMLYEKTFILGETMIRDAVDKLLNLAPVDIVVVPGNHDMTKAFHLGRSLELIYALNPDVTVDNKFGEKNQRKYYGWKGNLIGLTHGNQEKWDRLPMLMSNEARKMFSSAVYCEWQLGHWHHTKNLVAPLDEIDQMRIVLMPSLTPRDLWHSRKGYGAVRAAITSVFKANSGLDIRAEFRPEA